jgi:hypothetical protein
VKGIGKLVDLFLKADGVIFKVFFVLLVLRGGVEIENWRDHRAFVLIVSHGKVKICFSLWNAFLGFLR